MSRLSVPVDSAFGLANLPYGIYSVEDDKRRVAVRFGESVVDLGRLLGENGEDSVFTASTLNPFMAQGFSRWSSVRARIVAALSGDVADDAAIPLERVTLHLPIEVADYVDFYASECHAANLGRLFRPEAPEPLLPNWKHLPVGYHGRAASIVVSGTQIVRPSGQRKEPNDETPGFGPSVRLDIEAELGFVVGTGNTMGEPIPIERAEEHIFGVVLFNDWSARDIQAWEYVPLGPNLGKSFASTISPWVVPMSALGSARVDTPQQIPDLLPYLALERPWGLDVAIEVEWNGEVVSRPPYGAMYWSPAQMLAHLTVNGAPTRTGDLFASGTISGPKRDQYGSFVELTWNGSQPVTVRGERRTFLQDGDEVVLRASAPGADGTRIGFGEARGVIVGSRKPGALQSASGKEKPMRETKNDQTDAHDRKHRRVQLDEDHPGFADPEYRHRRDTIAAISATWVPGTPCPQIVYSEEEHWVWRHISDELAERHQARACAEFLTGKKLLNLPKDRVPQLEDVSRALQSITGFGYQPAAGLVALRAFYGSLADRRFWSTQYIRHHSVPDYTPEPDLVHEVMGHGNTLASERYCRLYEAAGRAVRRLETENALEFFSKVFWFTLEFGVVHEDGEPKAYGAGILSSPGELDVYGAKPMAPLDLVAMGTTEYDITHYQNVLYMAESFAQVEEVIGGFWDSCDDDTVLALQAQSLSRRQA
jgi:fumarylacetoacetase